MCRGCHLQRMASEDARAPVGCCVRKRGRLRSSRLLRSQARTLALQSARRCSQLLLSLVKVLQTTQADLVIGFEFGRICARVSLINFRCAREGTAIAQQNALGSVETGGAELGK